MAIEEKVRGMLAEVCLCSLEDISPSTTLVHDLEMDSFMMMDVISRIEKEFGIFVPDRDLARIRTVGDIDEYLRGKLA